MINDLKFIIYNVNWNIRKWYIIPWLKLRSSKWIYIEKGGILHVSNPNVVSLNISAMCYMTQKPIFHSVTYLIGLFVVQHIVICSMQNGIWYTYQRN